MPHAALRPTEADARENFLLRKNNARVISGSKASAAQLGVALGWIGVGIGIAELLMPRAVAQTTGLPPRFMRALGTREIITGAGILLRPQQPGWRWSRIAGDLLDLWLLAWTGRRTPDGRLTLITALVAGMTALDVLAAYDSQRHVAKQSKLPSTIRIQKSVYIQCPVEACYRFWRNFENFPQFMQAVESVQVVDATRTHWRVRRSQAEQIEWTIELFSDIPSQQLGWRTLSGSPIEHTGVVRFIPAVGNQGTRLDIDVTYKAPSSEASSVPTKLFFEGPSQQWDDDLRRFKQLIETGEIATTVGQPSGRRGALVRLLHREGKS